MYIIVGLGNPTGKYKGTRHNIGFEVIDLLAGRHSISMDTGKHKSLLGKGVINGHKVLLVKPMTFMNLSGEAIRSLVDYYKIDVESQLLVIFDDISLEPGVLRVRQKGSAGGHNGIKSIIAHLGTQNFPRIKVGVGGNKTHSDLADFVLGHFTAREKPLMEESRQEAVKAIETILSSGVEKAMNDFNGTKTNQKEVKEV